MYLAIAVPGPAVNQLRELTDIASAAADEAGFRTEMEMPGRADQSVRSRHVDALIKAAASELLASDSEQAGSVADIGPEVLTWRVLHCLNVRVLRLEGGDAADRTNAVGRLRQLTADGTAAAGDDLFARIAELAGRYASTGAVVTEERLRADLGIPLGHLQPRPAVSADAMLRGPVAHLGLAQQLDEADGKFETDPAAAGGIYGVIAEGWSAPRTPQMLRASEHGRPTRRMEPSPDQQAARDRIAAGLATAGFALPGTLTVRAYACGKPNCRCHADPPRLHGPYAEWTR